ncbi:MAG: hypothetical protein ACKO1T_04740 [Sediminibacterium sp.]
MQQLLYKYLILHNRLNIPSLGSFSVSYQPARLNTQTGTLDPKQPVLHFKDGPPPATDTGLIPFLVAEMNISPASAANQLLNFSLQVMSELVEHNRARLKGIGTLTRDQNGRLLFEQENSPVHIQSSVDAGYVPPAAPASRPVQQQPVSPVSRPVQQQPVSPASTYATSPSYPTGPSYPSTPPPRTQSPSVASAGAVSRGLAGQLDPSLDYAGLQSYQESPELAKFRQQLAQRREQVNSVFGDLREARERMSRIPLNRNGNVALPPTASPMPSTTPFQRSANPLSAPPPARPGRRPNPLLSSEPLPAQTPFWQSEQASQKNDSDTQSGFSSPFRDRSQQPWAPEPFLPPSNDPEETEPSFSPFEREDPLTSRYTPPTSPVHRSWQSPDQPETRSSVPFSRPAAPTYPGGTVRDMKRSPLRGHPSSSFPVAANPDMRPGKWAPQRGNVPVKTSAGHAATEEKNEEEETIKKGFFARLKSSIGRMFKKTKKEEAAPAKEKEKVKGKIKGKVTEEKVAEEKTSMSFREIIAQFADAFTEMKANELKALPEEKKDYWWAYSIVLTIFATIALIVHMF